MRGAGDATSILPPLEPEQTRHASAVLRAVRAAVTEHGGWLSFEDYLRLVLYAPGLGYYSAGSVKLGRAGDLVTAPELSELFGRALARQCADVLQRVGGDILELGAGSGALAATVLQTLQQLGSLPERYLILEVSAQLAARARERLAGLPRELRDRIQWLQRLPQAPFTGVCLANEVADALPFRLFVVGAHGFSERGVALGAPTGTSTSAPASSQAGLVLADRPADADLSGELQRIARELAARGLPRWPVGYQSELCSLLGPWIASLAAALSRGALLLIDYGLARHEYYGLERAHGTLRCHFRHRVHDDPLLCPGLQDISAWVDFTRIAEAATDARLQVAGYCTQAGFLLANDIEADVAAAIDTMQRARLASEARQLLLPAEMGEHFKVMALTRDMGDASLRGFAIQDLRHML
jgi:SAM-dependent MidA family methyltransferase